MVDVLARVLGFSFILSEFSSGSSKCWDVQIQICAKQVLERHYLLEYASWIVLNATTLSIMPTVTFDEAVTDREHVQARECII